MSEVKRYQADWHGMFLDLPGRRMGTQERLVVLAVGLRPRNRRA